MGLDQVLLSPIGICLFYTIIKTMEGEALHVRFDATDTMLCTTSWLTSSAICMHKSHSELCAQRS